MERIKIKKMMDAILIKLGRDAVHDENTELRDLGFRSLDFSELALRVEMEGNSELYFDAAALRRIRTVADVLDFLEEASRAA